MATMAKIGIICGTESRRTGLVAKLIGFRIRHFPLPVITSTILRQLGNDAVPKRVALRQSHENSD